MSDVEQAQQSQAQQTQAQEAPLVGVVAIPLAVGNGVVAIPLAVGNGVVGAAPLSEPLLKKIINIYKDLRPKT